MVIMFSCFCGTAQAGEDEVLARIGDTKITRSDLQRIVGYYDPEKQKVLRENPTFQATVLQRIVQGMVMARKAKESGLDKQDNIKEQLELLTNDFLATEYVKKEVLDKLKAPETDLKLYYDTHKEEFSTPELIKVRQIFVKVDASANEKQKTEAKQKAEGILRKIKDGEDFGKLATEFSDDTLSKAKGGDMGYISKGKIMPEFENVAFALKPGEVSEVVTTGLGYHILKVDEKKEAVLEPFEKIKDKVKERVLADYRQKKVAEFFSKSMEDAKAEIYIDKLLSK